MKKSRKVTMSQIAKDTGFSIATVSHVVNKTRYVDQETRKTILDAMERLDYAGKLISETKDSRLIGLVIADIREDFYIEFIKSAEVCAMENGYSLVLCDAEDDVKREALHLRNLLERGISGIIISPIDQSRIPDILEDSNVPAICVDRRYQCKSFDSVTINNFEAGRQLTECLLQKGVRTVSFIGYADSVYTAVERKMGYLQAMGSKNFEPHILQIPYHQDKILQRDIIDFVREGEKSFVCVTSHICFEVINALKEVYNKVPPDCYIGTFDENKWFRYLDIPLSIVKQPVVEMGFIAVELLVNRINNYSRNRNIKDSPSISSTYRKNIILDFEIVEV